MIEEEESPNISLSNLTEVKIIVEFEIQDGLIHEEAQMQFKPDILIKDMIDGEQEGGDQLSVNDFNGDTLSGLEHETDNFWRDLLFFMKDESSELGHTPILESDFPANFQSVYKYIADNCIYR